MDTVTKVAPSSSSLSEERSSGEPLGIPVPCSAATPEKAGPGSDNPKAIPSPPPSNTRSRRTAIFIQDECLKHRFIRSRDTSGIVERPERLHAVKLGLAAAIARIEDVESTIDARTPEFASTTAGTDESHLAAALARMAIASTSEGSTSPSSSFPLRTGTVTIRRTTASVSLLDHAAVKHVHGDIERDVYLENLIAWARDSQKNITTKGTEIPEGVPPLDLYRQYIGLILILILAPLTCFGMSRAPLTGV